MDDQEKVNRALVRIAAMRDNLKAEPDHERKFDERHVADFHHALDHLEQAGFDVAEFRVPDERLEHEFRGSNAEREFWSKERYIDRTMFMMRIESVLMLFDLSAQTERKHPIGFHGPRS